MLSRKTVMVVLSGVVFATFQFVSGSVQRQPPNNDGYLRQNPESNTPKDIHEWRKGANGLPSRHIPPLCTSTTHSQLAGVTRRSAFLIDPFSPLSFALAFAFFFKLVDRILVWYALRRNDEVHAKFAHGKTIFEIETKKRRDAP